MFENFRNKEEHDDFSTAFAALFGQGTHRNEFAGPPPATHTERVPAPSGHEEESILDRIISAVIMSMPECNTADWTPADYSLLYMVKVWIGIPAVSTAAGLLVSLGTQDRLGWFLTGFCLSYIVNWYAITAVYFPSTDGIAIKTMQLKAKEARQPGEAPEIDPADQITQEVQISPDLPPIQGDVIERPDDVFTAEQKRIFRLFEVGDIISRRTIQTRAGEMPGYDPFTEFYAGRFGELTDLLADFGFIDMRGQSKVWNAKGHDWSRTPPLPRGGADY